MKTKNLFGEIPQEDTAFSLYLNEIACHEFFDVPKIKKLAELVLEKLEHRRRIIDMIRVAAPKSGTRVRRTRETEELALAVQGASTPSPLLQ